MLLLHGSEFKHSEGLVLTARSSSPCAAMQENRILEMFRPPEFIAHAGAVFCCAKQDDLECCGAVIDHVYLVETEGIVTRHDLNWVSEICCLLDYLDMPSNVKNADERFGQMAESYWLGLPHSDESVWEYLTLSAKVMREIPIEQDGEFDFLEHDAELDDMLWKSKPIPETDGFNQVQPAI